NILSGENPIRFNVADPLPLFIVQTVIILALCYVVNLLMQRIRQPRVISEVLTGIILGPSILGKVPGFNDLIFPPQSIPFLTLVSNLGLVLFLFLVGLELDPKLIMKRAKYALGISIAGLAFPILARILAEMQLMSTPVGFITVCAAAAGDIVAWILLALLVSLIYATTPIMPLYVMLMAIALCVVLVYVVRPVMMSLIRLTHSEEEPSQKMIVITLIVVLSTAFVTNIIGIHSIFGGFLVGLLIPHDSGFAEGLTRRIEDLVGVYFLPIFFACSGRKTQIGLLDNGEAWGLVILVTLISCLGKMLGCVTAAKTSGMTWREALSVGFLMNCKGLVEYIILNIGHDAGVLNDLVFAIMITVCVILTMIATPFVGYLYPVSYQRQLETKREAERKRQESKPKSLRNVDSSGATKGGFLSRLTNGLQRRRAGKDSQKDMEEVGQGQVYEDLGSVNIAPSIHAPDTENQESMKAEQSPRKNSIMFCLDRTPNAPGVMTLLQLFSGTALSRRSQNSQDKHGHDSDMNRKKYQPSIDISDPNGTSRALNEKTPLPEYEATFSKIYAIRLLHISERTSAAMLTVSRCMDRLYKDTVMMMVMAFAKLNSIPLKPLVAISTDTAQSTVARDILDRAEDLNVGWIVFPVDNPADVSSHFPYNISRYFNHEEAQKIVSGGHVDLSQGGVSHRTSVASNTKVLSKLIPSSADSNISTAVLVDRGLGLFGGVEHIVVVLLGGEDDYEALCLASCLARSTPCFVTILRIQPSQTAQQQQQQQQQHTIHATEGQNYAFRLHNQQPSHSRQFSSDRSNPQTPHPSGGVSRPPSDAMIPKDDETLFSKFFPCKPRFKSGSNHRHNRQRNGSLDRTEHDTSMDDFAVNEELEKGIMAVSFHELSEAIQWAQTCLTAQDLLVMGFDSTALWSRTFPSSLSTTGQHSTSSYQPRTFGLSRAPSMDGNIRDMSDDNRVHFANQPSSPRSPASSPSLLERRALRLSPSPEIRLQQLPQELTPIASTVSTPGVAITTSPMHVPLPRASFEDGLLGRQDTTTTTEGSRRGRSRSGDGWSVRSLSKGRKAEASEVGTATRAGTGTEGVSSPLTTCQVMLGLAADKMMQSGVISSLLVVRSRWFSQLKYNQSLHDVLTTAPILGSSPSRPPTVGGNSSGGGGHHHHHRASSEKTRQYHTQQQQHHVRQHSDLSQGKVDNLDMAWVGEGGRNGVSRSRGPDAMVVDMPSPSAGIDEVNDVMSPESPSRERYLYKTSSPFQQPTILTQRHTAMEPIRVFITGVTGYISSTAVDILLNKVDTYSKCSLRALLLENEAAQADVVLSFADADHLPSIQAILKGLQRRHRQGRLKRPIFHTSGTGVLLDSAYGAFSSDTIS
ncbi:K(+)/H(+) antiporter, partial [Modicella reniformis]